MNTITLHEPYGCEVTGCQQMCLIDQARYDGGEILVRVKQCEIDGRYLDADEQHWNDWQWVSVKRVAGQYRESLIRLIQKMTPRYRSLDDDWVVWPAKLIAPGNSACPGRCVDDRPTVRGVNRKPVSAPIEESERE